LLSIHHYLLCSVFNLKQLRTMALQAIFSAMVKIASLKYRLFGEKGDPASPEARAALSIIASMNDSQMSPKNSIESIRKKIEDYGSKVGPPSGTKVKEIKCSGTTALWCELPKADLATCPVVVHFHGGGFVYGSARSAQGAILPALSRVPCIAVLTDFRLCPEHTPLDSLQDGLNVYQYLIGEQHIDPHRIVILGESAGGALAIRVAQAVQAAGLAAPSCVVAWSPWLDMTADYARHPFRDLISPQAMDRIRDCIPADMRRVRRWGCRSGSLVCNGSPSCAELLAPVHGSHRSAAAVSVGRQ
jgi:acetyl esterase/lipase